jgi:hypothetical protein
VGDDPSAVVAADFNRDGADDLAVVNFRGGTLTVYLSSCPRTRAARH